MKKHFLIMTMFVMNFINLLIGIDSNPTMSRVYGNQYTPSVEQSQNAGSIGTLVPTGIFGINGSLSLTPEVPNSEAIATVVLSTGIIAVLFEDTSNNGYVVEYMADGSVNTSFASGTGNILSLGAYSRTSQFITVDEQNRLLISGSDDASSEPWIIRITPEGVVDAAFTFVDGASWGATGRIKQLGTQSSGKIIAVGFNSTNAMIARYDLDGALDLTFGDSGYVILDGTGSLPESTVEINNVVIDVDNNLYIAYADTTPSVNIIRLTISGAIDPSWNSGNPVNMSYLDGTSMETVELNMILNSLGDLIVAVPSDSPRVIKAASIVATTGAAGTFADFTTSGGVFGTSNYSLLNMMATSDGSVYFLGSDTTLKKMAVIRCTSAGDLDTTFNNATGVNFFYPSGLEPSTNAIIYAGSIAPDGQIFIAGGQLDAGTTTPYLSSLYNNQYVRSVVQFPETQEQGTTDDIFGDTTIQTSAGIVSPFYGLYRSSLEQKIEAVTELLSGNIMAGMNGYLGTTPTISNMLLIRLLPTGELDPTFGLGGQVALPNITGTNEYITSILEDAEGYLYVTGYSDSGAIFRKYRANGLLDWNSDYLVAGYKGFGSGLEGLTRVLLFLGDSSDAGQINGYSVTDGSVDTTFNSAGSVPGQVLTDDFSLNMGSLYNGIVDSIGNIYITYKDTATGAINVASIFNAAASLIWQSTDVFSTALIAADDVRVSFNEDGNVVVASSLDTDFLITILDQTTGVPIASYVTPLTVTCGTDVKMKQVIGISDNTIVMVGYSGNGDEMLAARVTTDGAIDTTFDSQGPIPGVASIRVGTKIADYYARVASGITVQSHTGSNQGNLIMSGYEQLYSTDSTPMVMRVFGEPGTTQVKSSPEVLQIPGTFDINYNGDGIAPTYVLGASTPAANQEVRAIRQLVGTQIMTVITDNSTSISYLQRLNSDSSIDTTYGDGLGISIVKLSGTEVVQSMEFDGSDNFLITGSNSSSGGFVKRILSTGVVDTSFGGYNGNPNSALFPTGTTYDLMDTVNACQQLTNGNIVIVGSQDGVGMIQMLSATGKPLTTFGSDGQVTSGLNATSVSVDSSNNIYVSIAYTNGAVISARILKLNSAGQPVTSFGVSGAIDSALSSIDTSENLRVVFDDTLRPVIAGSFGDTSGLVVANRFNADGSVDTTFNGGSEYLITLSAGINLSVTGIVALQSNQTLISGYQQGDNYNFIVCLSSAGVLDGSFGAVQTGLVEFQASETAQLVHRLINMNVQADGNILVCGGDVPATDEETPLTFRFFGYPDVRAVPQFTGYQPASELPNVLNLSFNQTGIAETPAISGIFQVGSVASDSAGRGLIGGTTSTGLFVVARYLRNGLLDTLDNGGTGFGIDGIATSTVPITGLAGGKIAVDSQDRVYVGGASGSDQLLVTRFTDAGVIDTSFGSGGTGASVSILNLFDGAFITIDQDDKAIASGYSAVGTVVAARFNTDGTVDETFAASTSFVASIPVTALLSGGSIGTDATNNVVIAGVTSNDTMFVAMLDSVGVLRTDFGTSGIASTPVIPDLVDGGKLAVDSDNNIVVGGLTANQEFVVVKFLPEGTLDPLFNPDGDVPGMAYSIPVNILNVLGNIAIDNQNNIVVGGLASSYDDAESMIVARFSQLGLLDTLFTSVGMATSGDIPNLISGGFVATDIYDNIFVGGLSSLPGFIMAQMYSGYEIFVTDPSTLLPKDLKTYYYGNNTQYLTNVLSAHYFAGVISDPLVKIAVLSRVATTVSEYVVNYSGEPGWNFVWHIYRELNNFDENRIALIILYPESENEINSFFSKFEDRINTLRYES